MNISHLPCIIVDDKFRDFAVKNAIVAHDHTNLMSIINVTEYTKGSYRCLITCHLLDHNPKMSPVL